ncbi:hypothetical protein MKZ38_002176 [Zalerion maritima]|uniref:Uncharacterized protein n=1 Tax=Zalerion maritima TaxID=339359 RepID=A0AAD5RR16_9PEZI|nr:hypothetical protein MKZ38_002176 [Zalerion maritima]
MRFNMGALVLAALAAVPVLALPADGERFVAGRAAAKAGAHTITLDHKTVTIGGDHDKTSRGPHSRRAIAPTFPINGTEALPIGTGTGISSSPCTSATTFDTEDPMFTTTTVNVTTTVVETVQTTIAVTAAPSNTATLETEVPNEFITSNDVVVTETKTITVVPIPSNTSIAFSISAAVTVAPSISHLPQPEDITAFLSTSDELVDITTIPSKKYTPTQINRARNENNNERNKPAPEESSTGNGLPGDVVYIPPTSTALSISINTSYFASESTEVEGMKAAATRTTTETVMVTETGAGTSTGAGTGPGSTASCHGTGPSTSTVAASTGGYGTGTGVSGAYPSATPPWDGYGNTTTAGFHTSTLRARLI